MPCRFRLVAVAVVCGLSLAGPGVVGGEEFNLESYSTRLESLEAELAAMRGQMISSKGEDGSCVAPDIESWRIAPPCRCAGLIGGIDLIMMRPHASLGIRGADATDLHFDYETTPRLWVGWQGESGLGLRARYWEFDQVEFGDSQLAPGLRTDSISYDTYVFDLEVIDTMRLNAVWDVTLSAGLRYVEFTEIRQSTIDATGLPANGHSFESDSLGATLSAEVRRPLWRCLSGFLNTRGSVLFGDETERTGPTLTTIVDEENDNVYYMAEFSTGVDWVRPMSSGGEFFVRTAYEVQFWDNFTGEPFFDGGESIGFEGFVIGMGVRR